LFEGVRESERIGLEEIEEERKRVREREREREVIERERGAIGLSRLGRALEAIRQW